MNGADFRLIYADGTFSETQRLPQPRRGGRLRRAAGAQPAEEPGKVGYARSIATRE